MSASRRSFVFLMFDKDGASFFRVQRSPVRIPIFLSSRAREREKYETRVFGYLWKNCYFLAVRGGGMKIHPGSGHASRLCRSKVMGQKRETCNGKQK
jgi:hypothetical protein